MNLTNWLAIFTGTGLIGGAWKASAVFRDVVQLVRDTNALLQQHIDSHPGPSTPAPAPVESTRVSV